MKFVVLDFVVLGYRIQIGVILDNKVKAGRGEYRAEGEKGVGEGMKGSNSCIGNFFCFAMGTAS